MSLVIMACGPSGRHGCSLHQHQTSNFFSAVQPKETQARHEGGRGKSFPGPCDVSGVPSSLKSTEKGVPYGFFSDLKYA